MDLSSHDIQGEMAVPLNSSYGGDGGHGHGHMIHHDHDHPAAAVPHNHIISSSAPAPQIHSNNSGPSMTASMDDNHVPYNKKMVRYKECLKNHAAAMGGNATDGCGEFMPGGEEGNIEALTCLACNCHRNFHRKEIEGETSSSSCDCYHNNPLFDRVGRKVILSHHKSVLSSEALGYPTGGGGGVTLVPSRAAAPPHHPMIMSYNMGSLPSESEDQLQYGGTGVVVARPPPLAKKRFRTKFTQEQKEKMLNFAEKVGWKIQKQGEALVQQLCQEIGIKRRVLKVWMHNNKHSLAKKNSTTTTASTS